jgi:hypothetical protein
MRLRVMPRYALLKPNISRSPVCSECFVEVRLHNRSERELSPLFHGRLRNLK